MDAIITLDIGGTNTRCALFHTEKDDPVSIEKVNTSVNNEPAINRIIEVIEKSWPKDRKVVGIAAAAPGSIDVVKNEVILAPNIPGWRDYPLGNILQKHFDTKILVNNDARMAAVGEWKRGAGRGHNDILYYTVSTGLGGGVITGGQILQGSRGIATEVGHIVLDDNGPLCGCGKAGHFESFSSGTGIQHHVERKIKEGVATSLKSAAPSSREIAEAAVAGDKLAIEAFELAGYYMGIAVSNYLHIFNPSCVIFGGGVTQSFDLIMPSFRASMEKHVLSPLYLKNLKIALAELGDNAGLIGTFEYMKQNL